MPKTVFTHCNDCKKETNHSVLTYTMIEHSYNVGVRKSKKMTLYENYMIIECMGCNEVSFLKRESGNIYTNGKPNRDYIDYNYPESDTFNEDPSFLNDDEIRQLPKQIALLYEELQMTFENEANILAGIGLRMTIEAICLEQNIPGNNLKAKIEQLHTAGHISKNAIPILDKLREIGNVSAHEIRGLPINKLEYALEIVNHILKSIYILPKINRKLKLETIAPSKRFVRK